MKKAKVHTYLKLLRKWSKKQYALIGRNHLRDQFLHALPFWLGAFVTGIVAVMYAQLFIWAEGLTRMIFHNWKWGFFILTPLCFVSSWLLVVWYSPFARGSGIPQVSAALEVCTPQQYKLVERFLSLRVIVIKILSSVVMVIGGGAVGREGPTIQISAAICKKINDWLPSWYPKIAKKNMIVTGAASGLAAAFNTPLGGIVFAIEELTKLHFNFFKSALLVGVIIAGLTALNLLGPYLYIGFPSIQHVSLWVIPLVIATGVITGIACSGMGKIILFIFKKKRMLKTTFKHVLYLVISGLCIAAIAIFVSDEILGTGKETMVSILFNEEKYVEWYTPILRFFGTIVSFSAGGAGGIFAPSLSAGASIGSVIAHWFELSSSETNLIILCSMAAGLTGITRSPFTSSILVIEMTNRHNIIFYIMLTCLTANFVASFIISRKSFYSTLKDRFLREIDKV